MSRHSKRSKERGIKIRETQKQMLKIGEPCAAQKIYDFTSKIPVLICAIIWPVIFLIEIGNVLDKLFDKEIILFKKDKK